MATDFPGALDNFSNPSPSTRTRSGNPLLRHARQHSDVNDAIEAIQAKVGVDGSADPNSLDYRVTQVEGNQDIAQVIVVSPSASSGTAINAAIASLPSTGGTILLEGGTHTIDTAILFDRTITLEGVGTRATLLQFNPADVPVCMKMADTTQRRIIIRHMRINTTNEGVDTGTAIDMSYFTSSVVQNVRIGESSTQRPNIGIRVSETGTYYNHIVDCDIRVGGANSKAVWFRNDCNSNQLTNCRIGSAGAGGWGILIEDTHSLLITHPDIENQDIYGIDIAANSEDITIVGPYLEALRVGVRIASGCESIRMYGGYISTCTVANFQDNGGVGVVLDEVWVQFNPYSYVSKTGVVLNRINQRDVPSSEWQPDDLSAVAWAFDPAAISNSHTTVSGTLYLVRLNLRYPKTITNILFGVTTAATSVTANQNFVALYNSAGTRVAVSAAGTMDGPIASTGIKAIALSSPYAADAGTYWAALLFNASGTQANISRGQGGSLQIPNMGLTAASLRFCVNGTGLTSTPASITTASNSITGAATIWAGAS